MGKWVGLFNEASLLCFVIWGQSEERGRVQQALTSASFRDNCHVSKQMVSITGNMWEERGCFWEPKLCTNAGHDNPSYKRKVRNMSRMVNLGFNKVIGTSFNQRWM